MSGVMRTVTLSGSVVKAITDDMANMATAHNQWVRAQGFVRNAGHLAGAQAMELCRRKAAALAPQFGKAGAAYVLGIITITVDAKGELVWNWA